MGKPLHRLSPSLSSNLLAGLKEAPRDNFEMKMEQRKKKKNLSIDDARPVPRFHVLPRLSDPSSRFALPIPPPAVPVSAGPSCIPLGSVGGRRWGWGEGHNKGKQMNKVGKKSMIYIKHNCCHFTFHQVWWLLCENGCPTFLISSLFPPPFSPRSPLNQGNNRARPSRFTVKALHVRLSTVVSS